MTGMPGLLGGSNDGLYLPYFGSHRSAVPFGLARMEPVLEIAVAVAPRAARALGPAVHSAPCPSPDGRLPAGVPSSGLCPASAGFRHVRKSARHIGLTQGLVCHFLPIPLSLSGRIDNSNHPLGAGMEVDVLNLNGLLVASPMSVEGLDQIELKPQQLVGVV